MGILTRQFIKTPSIALETVPEHVWTFSLVVILLLLFNQAALFSLANSPLPSELFLFLKNTFPSSIGFLTIEVEVKMS